MTLQSHIFKALGTHFEISAGFSSGTERFLTDMSTCVDIATLFEAKYSRFRDDSLVAQMQRGAGTYDVGADMVAMLTLYQALYEATSGKFTPLIGGALQDTGYDAAYSLREQSVVRDVPPFDQVVTIVDETHIATTEPVSLDFGALGKGYLVDRLFEHLLSCGYTHVLVNGSGDIRYQGSTPIRCGLEDPDDPTRAIGVVSLPHGALCASAQNRRAWRDRTHYIDPDTKRSPQTVYATWVVADTAAVADAVASALFFAPPEALTAFTFSYLSMDQDRHVKSSADFAAELFTDTS